mmetsp:Transcript_32048/g.108851  ORF Transcript_32048/g.108851 Transcript_32048/m.108851 type:complete len:213 (+) Transcript_32048:160-798(+)
MTSETSFWSSPDHADGFTCNLQPENKAMFSAVGVSAPPAWPMWLRSTSASFARFLPVFDAPSADASTSPRRSAKALRSFDSLIFTSFLALFARSRWSATSGGADVFTLSLRFGVRSPWRTTAMTHRSSRMADVDDLGFCLGGFSLSWPMFGGAPVQEWAFCSLLSADAQSAKPSSEKSDAPYSASALPGGRKAWAAARRCSMCSARSAAQSS